MHQVDEALFTEFLTESVLGFGDTVGVADQQVARIEDKATLCIGCKGESANNDAVRIEPCYLPVPKEKWGKVPCVCIRERAGLLVEDGEEESRGILG